MTRGEFEQGACRNQDPVPTLGPAVLAAGEMAFSSWVWNASQSREIPRAMRSGA